jgi:hypothetical protein
MAYYGGGSYGGGNYGGGNYGGGYNPGMVPLLAGRFVNGT